MSIDKKYTNTMNLMNVIKNKMVSIINVELHYKDEDKIEIITPERFTYDLEFYSESGIFADSIEFQYRKTGTENLLINAGNMSPYCNCSIVVNSHLNESVTMGEVERELSAVKVASQSSVVDGYILDESHSGEGTRNR